MSTIDKHLNWGTAYMINDFYRPFVINKKSSRYYTIISRIFMVVLMVIALLVTTRLSSGAGACKCLNFVFDSG